MVALAQGVDFDRASVPDSDLFLIGSGGSSG